MQSSLAEHRAELAALSEATARQERSHAELLESLVGGRAATQERIDQLALQVGEVSTCVQALEAAFADLDVTDQPSADAPPEQRQAPGGSSSGPLEAKVRAVLEAVRAQLDELGDRLSACEERGVELGEALEDSFGTEKATLHRQMRSLRQNVEERMKLLTASVEENLKSSEVAHVRLEQLWGQLLACDRLREGAASTEGDGAAVRVSTTDFAELRQYVDENLILLRTSVSRSTESSHNASEALVQLQSRLDALERRALPDQADGAADDGAAWQERAGALEALLEVQRREVLELAARLQSIEGQQSAPGAQPAGALDQVARDFLERLQGRLSACEASTSATARTLAALASEEEARSGELQSLKARLVAHMASEGAAVEAQARELRLLRGSVQDLLAGAGSPASPDGASRAAGGGSSAGAPGDAERLAKLALRYATTLNERLEAMEGAVSAQVEAAQRLAALEERVGALDVSAAVVAQAAAGPPPGLAAATEGVSALLADLERQLGEVVGRLAAGEGQWQAQAAQVQQHVDARVAALQAQTSSLRDYVDKMTQHDFTIVQAVRAELKDLAGRLAPCEQARGSYEGLREAHDSLVVEHARAMSGLESLSHRLAAVEGQRLTAEQAEALAERVAYIERLLGDPCELCDASSLSVEGRAMSGGSTNAATASAGPLSPCSPPPDGQEASPAAGAARSGGGTRCLAERLRQTEAAVAQIETLIVDNIAERLGRLEATSGQVEQRRREDREALIAEVRTVWTAHAALEHEQGLAASAVGLLKQQVSALATTIDEAASRNAEELDALRTVFQTHIKGMQSLAESQAVELQAADAAGGCPSHLRGELAALYEFVDRFRGAVAALERGQAAIIAETKAIGDRCAWLGSRVDIQGEQLGERARQLAAEGRAWSGQLEVVQDRLAACERHFAKVGQLEQQCGGLAADRAALGALRDQLLRFESAARVAADRQLEDVEALRAAQERVVRQLDALRSSYDERLESLEQFRSSQTEDLVKARGELAKLQARTAALEAQRRRAAAAVAAASLAQPLPGEPGGAAPAGRAASQPVQRRLDHLERLAAAAATQAVGAGGGEGGGGPPRQDGQGQVLAQVPAAGSNSTLAAWDAHMRARLENLEWLLADAPVALPPKSLPPQQQPQLPQQTPPPRAASGVAAAEPLATPEKLSRPRQGGAAQERLRRLEGLSTGGSVEAKIAAVGLFEPRATDQPAGASAHHPP